MNALLLSCIYTVFLRTTVETASSPKRAWQLGDNAGAWEVETGYDAVYPTFSDPIKVGSGHPSMPFKAFYFDGSSDYVDLRITNDDQFTSFSIFMLVYPESTSGTLLHYKYGSGGTSGLDDITITATDSNVALNVIDGGSTWPLTQTSALTSNRWQYVLFKRDMDNARISLNVDGSSRTVGGPSTEFLGTPGTLRLGRNFGTGNYFTGKITCFLLYDTVFSDAEVADAVAACQSLSKTLGPSHIIDVDVPTTATTTTTTTTTAPTTTPLPHPISFWRLDNITYLHAIDGAAPIYPSVSQCVRLSDECPDIADRKALMLDGASVSYFDLKLSSQVIQGDFQIAFEVRPEYPSTGTILHYIHTGSGLGISEVRLSVSSTDITLTLYNSGTPCGQITQDSVLQSDTWHHVMIERSGSATGLTVDSNHFTAKDTCSGSAVNGSGYMHIGNSDNGDDDFRGSITCLGVYDYIKTGRKTSHITFCKDLIPAVSSFDTDICMQIPEMRHRYYSLERCNVQPEVGLSPVLTHTSISLRHCGRLCIETLYCRAFTMEVNVSGERECKLYDFVTRNEGLADSLGTNYYVIH